MLKSLTRKYFSTIKGDIKYLHCNATINFKDAKNIVQTMDNNATFDHIHSVDPIEGSIQSVSFCKLRTLQYHLKKENVYSHINKITIDMKSEFDVRHFFGTIEGPVKFNFLDYVLNVELDKSNPIKVSEEEFKKIIHKSANKCPMYIMIMNNGIPGKADINLI